MLSHAGTPSIDPPSPSQIRKYIPQHKSWPYTARDFTRSDETDDDDFYDRPRYVAHIDDAAIARLTNYFATSIPRKGRVLDFCTSWHSWYPDEYVAAVQDGELEVHGIGMNRPELQKNKLFEGHLGRAVVADLNKSPDIHLQLSKDGKGGAPRFDCATCTVSIDYLNKPVEVLSSLRECMNEGGTVHLVISNRCFPTKAVRIWLELDTEERLQLVGGMSLFDAPRNFRLTPCRLHAFCGMAGYRDS